MIDYSQYKKAKAEPEASSMIELFEQLAILLNLLLLTLLTIPFQQEQKIFTLTTNGRAKQQLFL